MARQYNSQARTGVKRGPYKTQKKESLTIRLSPEDRQALEAYADISGESISEVVRQALHNFLPNLFQKVGTK
jgi:predicted HicB family RNase H-like nuclease